MHTIGFGSKQIGVPAGGTAAFENNANVRMSQRPSERGSIGNRCAIGYQRACAGLEMFCNRVRVVM